MVSDKVGDLYVNYSNNHIGSDPVVSNPGLPTNGQNDYSQQWAEYYRCVQLNSHLISSLILRVQISGNVEGGGDYRAADAQSRRRSGRGSGDFPARLQRPVGGVLQVK